MIHKWQRLKYLGSDVWHWECVNCGLMGYNFNSMEPKSSHSLDKPSHVYSNKMKSSGLFRLEGLICIIDKEIQLKKLLC